MKPTRTHRAIPHPPSLAPHALRAAAVVVMVWLLGCLPAGPWGVQPFPSGSVVAAAGAVPDMQPHGADAAQTEGHAAEGAAGGHEAQSPWALVARLFNFALLAGTLVYFLRSPLMAFLKARGVEIRGSLASAAELKARAARQTEEIESRLAALPAEIAALEARGTEEIAAEEARITGAAEAERARLVEQARRQVDLQLRTARRDLTAHAADAAIARAAQRLRTIIDDEDQRRLVDRYLARVNVPPQAGAERSAPDGSRP